ncbi:hypothetical protein T02_3548 [Trichinella nativa]|uniref:Uncharacterized protein n=1 Tax=Trichinella nativa TaxID=6335 RepID=A0A0V1LRQ3_9BILA|nr:hypothetical protein T02_3548 [Trichinella nativa]
MPAVLLMFGQIYNAMELYAILTVTDVPPWQPRNPFLCENEGTLTHMVLFQHDTDTERDEASQSGNRINEDDVGEADIHDRVRQIKNK